MRRIGTRAAAYAVSICAIALGATGCPQASDAVAGKDDKGNALIFWRGPASRICVTEENADCPKGKDDRVTGGQAYWVIDATCYNAGAGFSPPVSYGVVPECAKDVSEAHGGKAGGIPLEVGKKYKVTIASFNAPLTVTTLAWD